MNLTEEKLFEIVGRLTVQNHLMAEQLAQSLQIIETSTTGPTEEEQA